MNDKYHACVPQYSDQVYQEKQRKEYQLYLLGTCQSCEDEVMIICAIPGVHSGWPYTDEKSKVILEIAMFALTSS